MGQNQKLCRGKVAPPRPPRTKIKHFHGQHSEDIEAGLGKKCNTGNPIFPFLNQIVFDLLKKDLCNEYHKTRGQKHVLNRDCNVLINKANSVQEVCIKCEPHIKI